MQNIYFPKKLHSHRTPNGHPESWTRLKAIQEGLSSPQISFLNTLIAPIAPLEIAAKVHASSYLDMLGEPFGDDDPIRSLDGMDTWLDYDSLQAALGGVGSAIDACEKMANGELLHSFVATRPPGHHALHDTAMGFCLLGTAAIAAIHARDTYGYRVAVLDFDLHHGNGTQALLQNEANVFFASTQEKGQWPATPKDGQSGQYGHIRNRALPTGSGEREMKKAWSELLDQMRAFQPDMIIVSAGFDAHQDDPLSGLKWQTQSYGWLAEQIALAANVSVRGGVLSILEGGYEQKVLRKAVPLYLSTLENTLA